MDVRSRELFDYRRPNGDIPFRTWLSSLGDKKTQAVVDARLARVRKGNFGNCEPVGDGVLELKIYLGPGLRVYFGLDGARLVVLLCGGSKSRQSDDIKKAKEFWIEYRSGK